MVRVLVWGTRGPRFESALPDQRGSGSASTATTVGVTPLVSAYM